MRTSIVALIASAGFCISTVASAEDATSVTMSGPDAPPSRPSLEARGHVIMDSILSYGTVPAGGLGFGGLAGYSSSVTNGTLADGSPAPPASTLRTTYTWFTPSLDYVFARRFTIGTTLLVQNQHFSSTTAANGASEDIFVIGLIPRIGYIRALTDDIAIWTRVGGGAVERLDGSAEWSMGWQFVADSSLVFRAGRHVIASLGPSIQYSQSRSHATPHNEVDGTTTSFSVGGRVAIGLVF